jgi:hypothetical protein
MIITEFDGPLTAEDARKIAINNRDDSVDRSQFRSLMNAIRDAASRGYTRHVTQPKPKDKGYFDHPTEFVQNALRSFGFKVVEKRAYLWDSVTRDYSNNKPFLSNDGRDQFFLEITWG